MRTNEEARDTGRGRRAKEVETENKGATRKKVRDDSGRNKSADAGLQFTIWPTKERVIGKLHSCMWPAFLDLLNVPEKQAKPSEEENLPLMRLAQFKANSRETGKAVVERLYGIEGDYDAGVVLPTEAAALLKAAGVRGVICTTKRHTDAAPRWRVFAPLSKPHAPSTRPALLARLNGVFSGVLAAESFEPLRCYFVGRVAGVPYRVHETKGRCIDRLPALDAGAVYPARMPAETRGNAHDKTKLTEGEGRNKHLWHRHVELKRAGLKDEALVSALNWINETECDPPLTAKEMRETVARPDGSYAEARMTPAQDFKPVVAQRIEWAAPHDLFAKMVVPPARVEYFPPVIARYAFEQGGLRGSDPAMIAFAALASGAAMLSDENKLFLRRSTNWKESARLWVVIVGDSGVQKSPAMKAGAEPAFDYDATLQSASRAQHDFWRASGEEGAPPPWQQLIFMNFTVEGLADGMQQNTHGVLVYADELSEFLGRMDAYNSAGDKDRGSYLRLYDGGPESILRAKGRRTQIDNWSASLLVGIQPAVLRKINQKKQLTSDGLLQRMIPINVTPRTEWDENGVSDPELRQRFLDVFKQIPQYRLGVLCELDSKGQALFDEYEKTLLRLCRQFDDTGSGLSAFLSKLPAMIGRCVLTYHAIEAATTGKRELPQIVPSAVVEQVLLLVQKYVLPNTFMFYNEGLGVADPALELARHVAEVILAKRWDQFTYRDLEQQAAKQAWRGQTEEVRSSALAYLVSVEWLREVISKKTKRGRPAIGRWEVNPAVPTTFRVRAERITREREQIKAAWDAARGEDKTLADM